VVTVKLLSVLLSVPFTLTTTLPVVAPLGTGATMLVAVQLVGVAVVPLNFSVLEPCGAPKLLPVIVTDVPIGPEVGDRLLILGPGVVTVKLLSVLLLVPPTFTTTLPVVAPLGTTATMLVAVQVVTDVAAVPPNFSVLVPCGDPKLLPATVTDVPTGPEAGDRLSMWGAAAFSTAITRSPSLMYSLEGWLG
jgi:hypothetical protein